MAWYEYTDLGEGVYRPLVGVRLRRGDTALLVPALVDSGADQSVFDLALVQALGLDPAAAQGVGVSTADGRAATMLRWPDADLTLEFAGHEVPFEGQFVDAPPSGDFINLLGREDFFTGLIVQFWNDRRRFNLDSSPDWLQDPLRWTR